MDTRTLFSGARRGRGVDAANATSFADGTLARPEDVVTGASLECAAMEMRRSGSGEGEGEEGGARLRTFYVSAEVEAKGSVTCDSPDRN